MTTPTTPMATALEAQQHNLKLSEIQETIPGSNSSAVTNPSETNDAIQYDDAHVQVYPHGYIAVG
jgi:hypothetical protein